MKKVLLNKVDYKRAIVVLGPRQVGKTTLITEIASSLGDYLYINGDDPETRLLWDKPSQSLINRYIGKYKVVVIDEAQRLRRIGQSAKMIIDSKTTKLIHLNKLQYPFLCSLSRRNTHRSYNFNILNEVSNLLILLKWCYLERYQLKSGYPISIYHSLEIVHALRQQINKLTMNLYT